MHIVDPFSDSETPTESERQTNDVDVACAKVSPRTTSKTAETSRDGTTSRTAQHADVSTTDDVKNDVDECPMCFKEFPKDTIHLHAFLCNGVDEASTSSVR